MSKGNKSIKSAVNKALIFGIVSAILFVVGIPLIVMGASNQVWAVLVFGIVFVVFGFYGSPMIWINYANLRSMKRVVDAVNEEHLLSNEEIATQLQMNERVVKSHITKAINKKYLTGYLYDGTTLSLNEKTAPKKKAVIANKCANCGGSLTETETGWICDYCGSKFNKE